jgi:hypothetical protein
VALGVYVRFSVILSMGQPRVVGVVISYSALNMLILASQENLSHGTGQNKYKTPLVFYSCVFSAKNSVGCIVAIAGGLERRNL